MYSWIIINGLYLNFTHMQYIVICNIVHCNILQSVEHSKSKSCFLWRPPPPNTVKLNVDAVVSDSVASLAVLARDFDGNILKCWAKRISLVDPCVVEAIALAWAGEIALEEHLSDIIVEGDSKVCIDAVLGRPDKIHWAI